MSYFRNMKKRINKNRGSGLLEVVIVVSILSLVVTASTAAAQLYITYSMRNMNNVKAGYLLEEGVEVVKIMRDISWTTHIAPRNNGATTSIAFQSGSWGFGTSSAVVDGTYRRTVRFDQAFRDAGGDLDTSGSNEPDARLVTVTVEWNDPVSKATTSKSLSTYVVNLFEN